MTINEIREEYATKLHKLGGDIQRRLDCHSANLTYTAINYDPLAEVVEVQEYIMNALSQINEMISELSVERDAPDESQEELLPNDIIRIYEHPTECRNEVGTAILLRKIYSGDHIEMWSMRLNKPNGQIVQRWVNADPKKSLVTSIAA